MSRSDHSSFVFSLFWCLLGRELDGHSMLCVWFVYFYVWPDMVLDQRQVLVIVSDWEPYLGSPFCVGFCG